MKHLTPKLLLGAALLGGLSTLGLAQIERLDLEQMSLRTDNAVYGEIVARTTFRVDHPVDGDELYFTRLTIAGESLVDGHPLTVQVTYAGGKDPETGVGVWNSEAPAEADVARGNRIVAFYKWSDNLGGDVAGNALYAAHGGLYRTLESPTGPVVLGRGDGYAVRNNIAVGALRNTLNTVRQVQK